MEKHLYFVRHGESTSNKEGIAHGKVATLTEEGRQQAEIVAERFTRIPVDAIVSSSFIRAQDTAEPIAHILGLPIETSDLLVEYRRPSIQIGKAHTDPEMKSLVKELTDNYTTPGYRHSDEENFEDIRERALAAVAFLETHPAERLCVVTHGIFMRALFCAFLAGPDFTGRDYQNSFRMHLSNTGITYVHASEGEWRIHSWNDSSHLG